MNVFVRGETKRKKRTRVLWWIVCFSVIFIAAVAIGAYVAIYHRAIPEEQNVELWPGCTHQRFVLEGPNIVNVVWIDLQTPGLFFLVTPPNPNGKFSLRGQTTTEFLQRHKLSVAVNGDFFQPWHSNGPFDYYPHAGDGVNVLGFAASEGRVYSDGAAAPQSFLSAQTTVYISRRNEVSFGRPIGEVFNAISGGARLLQDGNPVLPAKDRAKPGRHPRTVLGTRRTGRELGWLVVDGRQPNYSVGATLAELEQIVLDAEFEDAVFLDGGGSSTLARTDQDGDAKLLNSPINFRIPGIERNIGNHLGAGIRTN